MLDILPGKEYAFVMLGQRDKSVLQPVESIADQAIYHGLFFSGRLHPHQGNSVSAISINHCAPDKVAMTEDRDRISYQPLKRVVKPQRIPELRASVTGQHLKTPHLSPKTIANATLSNGSLLSLLLSRGDFCEVMSAINY